jgi:hypothetical protein
MRLDGNLGRHEYHGRLGLMDSGFVALGSRAQFARAAGVMALRLPIMAVDGLYQLHGDSPGRPVTAFVRQIFLSMSLLRLTPDVSLSN